MELKWMDDFEKTVERFEAWWRGEIVDRPPTTVFVKPTRCYSGPDGTLLSAQDKWMNVEYAVESGVAKLQQCDYVGDTLPIFWPNLGPHLIAALFGGKFEFTESIENGAWSKPVISQPEDWEYVLDREPDFANPYWHAVEQMTDYALEIADNQFIVGISDLMGNYDVLAALRGTQELCTDIIDCPEIIKLVGRHITQGLIGALERLYGKISAAGFGSTTWCPMYHRGLAYIPSCDFWCTVSTSVARELILPDILREMKPLERSIFHLDGIGALRHLDLILEIEQLDAIEWVYGAGAGPASRWIDVYRRIIQAGKSVEVLASDGEDALNIVNEIGTKGVWIHIHEKPFESKEDAKSFLREVEKCFP